MDAQNLRILSRSDRIPRLGWLGLGWIARLRLKSLLQAQRVEVAAMADPHEPSLKEASALVPTARCGPTLDWLLEQPVDAIVISTPSALHADHAIAALDAGKAVFCQKPLARNLSETESVIASAQAADRLLGVDFSYRWVSGVREMKSKIRKGELGLVYAADLVFHNAYGPDKPWYRALDLSGGGCVMDLGIHFIDLLLWIFHDASVVDIDSRLYSGGGRIDLPAEQIEDYAAVRMDLDNGLSARLTCSWNISAGRNCVIGATFYGTQGALSLSNVEGSFYDLRVEEFKGTSTQLIQPADHAWGSRALEEWTQRLANDDRYDPEVESVLDVASVIDGIYGRKSKTHPPISKATALSSEGRFSAVAEWLSNLHNLCHASFRAPS
jgi:predicted dehydrogenase